MKVICTKTEIFVAGKNPGGISIHKGSIYTVVDIKSSEWVAENNWDFIQPGGRPASGDWYELLEVKGYHHSCNFIELPDYLFEPEESEKKLEEVE